MAGVIVTGVVMGVGTAELLGCGGLSLGVKVLDLSLTENTSKC